MGAFPIGYQISGEIGDTCAYQAFILNTVCDEILIVKS